MFIFPSLQAKDLNAIREEFPFTKYFANAPQVEPVFPFIDFVV